VDLADLVAAVSLRQILRRLARERLVHFAILGALIFWAAPASRDNTRISLTSAELAALRAAQAQRLGVTALDAGHTAEVDRRAIEDEVLYREGLRLGLDRGDPVMRRHLVQKMLVLAEDLAGATREPTADEIASYFARTRNRWRVAERLHIIHVFAARRETLLALADQVRASPPGVAPPLGDAFPHARDLHGSREDLAASYGDEFATAVAQLGTGTWSAPIQSRFGWHLVEILDRDAGRPAELAEVADRVRLELAVERRHDAIAKFLAQAFARYHVDIDGKPMTDYQPTARLALRTQPSAED
jgi:hypothetical protein